MNNEIEEIRRKIKNKKKKQNIKNNFKLTKFLLTIIITLVTLILLKNNTKLKTSFYKNIFDKNIKFSTINKMYKEHFGSPIPFSNILEKNEVKQVFSEKLEYTEKNKYLDGVKLTVSKNYLVPVIESGMVVFIGDKENYGKTVIIEQTNGVDVWYSNINVSNIKLYDYLEKGKLIGEVKDKNLYLLYKKDGKVLNYEDYL